MYCRCCKKVATVLMKKLSPQNLGASDADCSRCTPSPCTKEKKSSTDDWSPWNRIPRTPSFVIPSFPESLVRFMNSYCWSFAQIFWSWSQPVLCLAGRSSLDNDYIMIRILWKRVSPLLSLGIDDERLRSKFIVGISVWRINSAAESDR